MESTYQKPCYVHEICESVSHANEGYDVVWVAIDTFVGENNHADKEEERT